MDYRGSYTYKRLGDSNRERRGGSITEKGRGKKGSLFWETEKKKKKTGATRELRLGMDMRSNRKKRGREKKKKKQKWRMTENRKEGNN